MKGLGRDGVVSSLKVFTDELNVELSPHENAFFAQHQFELGHAGRSHCRDKQRFGNGLVLWCLVKTIQSHWSDLFEHLRRLRGQQADENDIALFHNFLVVEFSCDAEFLNEWSEQMWLSCWHIQFQIVKTAWNLEQLGQYHCAKMSTPNNANLKWRHLVQKLYRVLDLSCAISTISPRVHFRLLVRRISSWC